MTQYRASRRGEKRLGHFSVVKVALWNTGNSEKSELA